MLKNFVMTIKQKEKYFKDEINKYINLFGLLDYAIEIEVEKDVKIKACTYWHGRKDNETETGRIITFCYGDDWIRLKETDKKEISMTAFHEVLELMFSTLRDLAEMQGQYVSKREVDDEVHSIIRRMENVIFPKIYQGD